MCLVREERKKDVILSATKDLSAGRTRSFVALRMTKKQR